MNLLPDVQNAVDRFLSANSLSEVQKIAESLSAARNSPNGVLCSGRVFGSSGSVQTTKLAAQFAQQSGVSIIDNTERAQFLDLLSPINDSGYYKKLLSIIKNSSASSGVPLSSEIADQEAKAFLFGGTSASSITSSLWGQASAEFASSLTGDVTVIASAANPARVFGLVEIPAILNNPNVTSFAGAIRPRSDQKTPL